MGKISLDEIVAKVDDIPGFSDVILRVMRLTEDPDSTAEDIQNVLVQDQGLTVKVLRLANSAHYGFARRIDTISQATILLGFQTIRSIVLAASCSPMLKKEMEGYGWLLGAYTFSSGSHNCQGSCSGLQGKVTQNRLILRDYYMILGRLF